MSTYSKLSTFTNRHLRQNSDNYQYVTVPFVSSWICPQTYVEEVRDLLSSLEPDLLSKCSFVVVSNILIYHSRKHHNTSNSNIWVRYLNNDTEVQRELLSFKNKICGSVRKTKDPSGSKRKITKQICVTSYIRSRSLTILGKACCTIGCVMCDKENLQRSSNREKIGGRTKAVMEMCCGERSV